MAGTSGIGFGARLMAGAVLAVAVTFGAYFTYQTLRGAQDVPPPVPPIVTPPAPTPAADQAAQPTAPSFDVVRIEPDGASVIAGNAAPGADVAILLDGAEIGQASADPQGNFVALLTVPTGQDAQVLSLASQPPDGALVVSNDSVILAPIAQAEPEITDATQAQPAAPDTAPNPATAPAVADHAVADAPVMDPTPTAPAVLLANPQGVRVIQPAGQSPTVMDNVVIDAISYDALGDVQLSGRGAEAGVSGFVRVYLNDAPIQTTPIGIDGGWHTALPNVDTGLYTLRIDQVDAAGTVTSRTQTPFKRETAEVLATAQTANPAQQVSAITVQPGSTLWAIARQKYGDGMLYVRVFEANSDSILNPDLIYPGQVFQVPE